MRSLFVLEIVLGVACIVGGTSGLILWTRAYSAYIPALSCGLMYIMCGWWGLQSSLGKSLSEEVSTSLSLHVVSLSVSLGLLIQSAVDVAAYTPQGARLLGADPLASRGNAVSAMFVDVGLVSSATLYIFLALAAISCTRRRLTRQANTLPCYGNSFLSTQPVRLPVTHAWSYTPTLAEADLAALERDRHFLNTYAAVGNTPTAYQLPHLSHASVSNREARQAK